MTKAAARTTLQLGYGMASSRRLAWNGDVHEIALVIGGPKATVNGFFGASPARVKNFVNCPPILQ